MVKAIIAKYLAPAAAVLAVSFFVGWCAERDARIRQEAIAEELRRDFEVSLEAWRRSRQPLVLELARRTQERDSLAAVSKRASLAAALSKQRADSFARRMALLLPDTGDVRETWEGFVTACRDEADSLRVALSACELAGLKADSSIDDLTARLARADTLLEDANAGWAAAEKRANPGFVRRLLQAQPYVLAEGGLVALLVLLFGG